MNSGSLSFDEKITYAADLIKNSNHLVLFTGAGISTESGLPDYRGPDGVWTRRDKGLPPKRLGVRWSDVDPNEGHKAIVELQNLGLLKFLISQNVDGLHLKSGIDSDKIAELHGNSTLMKCMECDKRFQKDEIWNEKKWGKAYRTYKEVQGSPRCDCGGRIISSVINFGDPMPEKEIDMSEYHSDNADVFLVIGSSLSVTPASHMPIRALKNNAKLIIINQMDTPMDNRAEIRFFESAGEVLTLILTEITS
jgi:mono-ADP-ribosyltransferase sirtuin 6